MGTSDDCDIGFINLFIDPNLPLAYDPFYQALLIGVHKVYPIKTLLSSSPVAVAMIIPDCFSGHLTNLRGGIGGICDRPGICE